MDSPVANKTGDTIKNDIQIVLSAKDIHFYALRRNSPCMNDKNSTRVQIILEWEFFVFQSTLCPKSSIARGLVSCLPVRLMFKSTKHNAFYPV